MKAGVVHLIAYHYALRFRCGIEVKSVCDRDNGEWAKFNKIRTTTIKEATCPGCLEWAYAQKLKELRELETKLGWAPSNL